MEDVGQDAASGISSPPREGLLAALLAEGDVDPAREEVLGVPRALAVAQQHEPVRRTCHARSLFSVGRGRPARSQTLTGCSPVTMKISRRAIDTA